MIFKLGLFAIILIVARFGFLDFICIFQTRYTNVVSMFASLLKHTIEIHKNCLSSRKTIDGNHVTEFTTSIFKIVSTHFQVIHTQALWHPYTKFWFYICCLYNILNNLFLNVTIVRSNTIHNLLCDFRFQLSQCDEICDLICVCAFVNECVSAWKKEKMVQIQISKKKIQWMFEKSFMNFVKHLIWMSKSGMHVSFPACMWAI